MLSHFTLSRSNFLLYVSQLMLLVDSALYVYIGSNIIEIDLVVVYMFH
jgi:hypothetical protein